MRLERISLIAVMLLVLTGCSANRHSRKPQTEYQPQSPVSMPLRHADEYESDPADLDNLPSDRGRRPAPPPIPDREPVPAPPAIGVSRVKSVSWFRAIEKKSDQNTCASERCGDGYMIGKQTKLQPEYFGESCSDHVTPECLPGQSRREKPTLFETIRNWKKIPCVSAAAPVCSRNCGERAVTETVVGDRGCSASEGCARTGSRCLSGDRSVGGRPVDVRRDSGSQGGSPADPINKLGREKPFSSGEGSVSPDESLELPSVPNVGGEKRSPKSTVPDVPEAQPLIPKSDSVPAEPSVETPEPAAAAPLQATPNAVKHIVQPPLWPRLTGPGVQSVTSPRISSRVLQDDTSLPLILPGRRI